MRASNAADTHLRELIAHAKARPDQLTYASPGNGGPQHLAGELFKYMAGLAILHMPFKGSAPALTDLPVGRVQLSLASLLAALPHVKAGKLRALGLTSSKRPEAHPEIPTVAEAGAVKRMAPLTPRAFQKFRRRAG